jgi:hypothetical protein
MAYGGVSERPQSRARARPSASPPCDAALAGIDDALHASGVFCSASRSCLEACGESRRALAEVRRVTPNEVRGRRVRGNPTHPACTDRLACSRASRAELYSQPRPIASNLCKWLTGRSPTTDGCEAMQRLWDRLSPEDQFWLTVAGALGLVFAIVMLIIWIGSLVD